MQTYLRGTTIAAAIMILYRLYIIFEITSVAVSTCSNGLNNPTTNKEGVTSDGWTTCVGGQQTFYSDKGVKSGRTVNCGDYYPELLKESECVVGYLSNDQSMKLAIQLIITAVIFVLVFSDAVVILRLMLSFFSFFGLNKGLMAPKWLPVIICFTLLFGDLMLSALTGSSSALNSLVPFGSRDSRGRYSKS
jgi:hypothetical protein